MERVHIIVHGTVQGVFFRANTIRQARALGLSGFVRNLPDGTVETIAEGPRESLEQFASWCGRGPETARVSRVDKTWGTATGEFEGFDLD